MKKWNTEVSEFLEKITDFLIKYLNEWSNAIFIFVKTYNSLLALLLFIIIGVPFLKKVFDKEVKEFSVLKIFEVILNILIAVGLGYLVKLANIEGLIKVLSLIWSVSVGLVIFFLVLLIREIVIYIKSTKKIVAGYSDGYLFLGLIYLFASIASNQFEAINNILMIIYFLNLWMFVQLINHNNRHVDIEVDEDSDNAINSYSQLLPTRKMEFNRVYNQLTNVSYSEPFAITINGDWGEGKTSFVNVLSNKLEENNNYIIFIQPMVLDTSEKQMDYLFKQLKLIMNKNGIYTGNGSPFKQYLKIITNVLNAKPLLQLEKVFSVFNDEELPSDFRTNKHLLEEDIQRLLRMNNEKVVKKKIFIIVDDFDRVEKETMYNTLVFIKELVHFKGVNVIFLMDEQKLEAVKENKINKEYLDKFVNNKIQMSKIDSSEIFNHFISNIKVEDFKSDFVKAIVKELKGKVNNQIEQVQLMTKDKIAEVEKTIEDLTSNNGKQKEQNKEEDNKSERYEKLQINREQLISFLERFNSGVTNLRKAKKVVREIKEILIICDEQNNNSNYSHFVINMKKGKINEKIANLAFLKILFSEFVDEIIKRNDTREFIYETNVDFFKIMFEDLGYSSFTEDKELMANIVNLFCNSILLNKPLDNDLFSELRTNSEEILKKLDSPGVLNFPNNHFEVIKEYLSTIKLNSATVPNNIVLKRLEKLIEYIFVLYDNEVLSLKNLFELLSKPQRNPLIDHPLYFEKIYKILQQETKFESENDKKASVYILDQIEPHLLARYRGDIIIFISLLKSKEGNFTYQNFVADLGGIIRLDEMNKEIKNIFQENDNSVGVEFLANWTERASLEINKGYSGNKYILDSIGKYKKLIDNFIKTYGLWEKVKFKVKNLSVNHQSKFKEKLGVNSLQELKFDINEFYEYINKGNSVEPHLYYFNSILINLESYTRVNNINDDVIQIVEDIYQKLNNEDLNEISVDSEQLLLWCTVNLGEIKENLKKTENKK
ncbi:P-loop NTPase fold protein [Rossellomorea aquimaris]|uniref:P-loop NTPase fold protein n=1 Tax=Rossellomorea aquimaris TaxID=189382 RepID=UPI0037C728FC